MSEFNHRKWFKKQYLEEGHTEDKMERDMEALKRSRIKDNELKKLDAMRDFYTVKTDVLPADLKEDDLNEISRDAYDRMEGLANQRDLNELKDLIMILGGEWANEGFENEDIVDYFEDLVYNLVRS